MRFFFFYAEFLHVEPDGDPRGPKDVADMTAYSCARRNLTVCLLNIRKSGMTSKLECACIPVKLHSYFVYFYIFLLYLFYIIYKYI